MPEQAAPEWLIEEGIAETRALFIDGEQVLAAKIIWPGERRAGELCSARIVTKFAGTRRGIAVLDGGSEALVDHLPASITEGQTIPVTITRAALAERGRLKRAQVRTVTGEATTARLTPSPLDIGRPVRRLPAGMWEDVWQAASSASLDFPGGEILVSVTPAMTVIDIDGIGAPRDIALAAVPAIAQAIDWFDLGGNIGIDFPTIADKADRRAVDESLAAMLNHWAHERTAMNGFGFVQIVARLEGPSLLHRFASTRLGVAARMALRRAELAAEGTGRTLLLTVHPALKAKLKEQWLTELSRRTGRAVEIVCDPALAIEAAYAQLSNT